MRIYYTGVDNGDGSLGVEFFDCQEALELLEEHDYETYRGGGGFYFDCDNFTGKIKTLNDAKQQIINMGIDREFLNSQ